jgi:hypothetical protein
MLERSIPVLTGVRAIIIVSNSIPLSSIANRISSWMSGVIPGAAAANLLNADVST